MKRYTFGVEDTGVSSTMVATDGDVIWGFISTGPSRVGADGPARGEIFALYVDLDVWNRGVGRRLMSEALAHLTRQGFDAAILWVLAGNERADRFYCRNGWLPDGSRRTRDVWGVRVEEMRYQRGVSIILADLAKPVKSVV